MNSGHLTAAVTTAQNHAVRLDRETGIKTPESLSVYGSLLLRGAIDVALAFFQWGKYEQAHAALRAAEDTAPQEVAARPSVGTLARNLATLAPASIRRDAEQFASRIGASR